MQATDLKVGMQFKDLDGDIVNIIHLDETNQSVSYIWIVNGIHNNSTSTSYSEFIEYSVEEEWELIYTPPFTLDIWHKIDPENLPICEVLAWQSEGNKKIGYLMLDLNRNVICYNSLGTIYPNHYITLSELNQIKFE